MRSMFFSVWTSLNLTFSPALRFIVASMLPRRFPSRSEVILPGVLVTSRLLPPTHTLVMALWVGAPAGSFTTSCKHAIVEHDASPDVHTRGRRKNK